ncbi:MAG: hypothetical protein JW959_11045 [Pirellulales bacterium]|nr:hypothetical protein [Pirellulales bacterium]
MTVETSNPSMDAGVADALAEIHASATEASTFLEGLIERLDGLADSLPAREETNRRALRGADRAALDEQIERLAALADELAESISRQKKFSASVEDGQGNGHG